jgi:CRISPR-associated protein Csm1
MAEYKEIVLAAWLHDIGIFSRRADIEPSEQFLLKVNDCFPKDINLNVDEVIRLVGAWRKPSPDDYYARLIAHGDRLSRGNEFSRDDENEPYYEPLVHLVSTVQIDDEAQAPDKCYIALNPLDSTAIFPTTEAPKVDKQEYRSLWDRFVIDFRLLKENAPDYSQFILSLDTLLERYCWCIPVSREAPDINLYQHLKLSAAFTGALYLYHRGSETETIPALDADDKQAFRFIQGDLSGIQKYIFDLKTTKDSAKLLRARSFQIWTLGEIIAEYIIKQIDISVGKAGISRESIITSAGGKFLLLAPNNREVIDILPKLRLKIESFFLREFAGRIAFILSDTPASGGDLRKGTIQDLLNAIGMKGDEAKQKKMQAVLRDQDQSRILEQLYNDLHDKGECDWCETLPANSIEDDGKKICNNCKSLIDIGGKLVKADKYKIVFNTDELSSFAKMVDLVPKNDSRYFGYLTEYEAGFPLMSLPYAAPRKARKDDDTVELYKFDDIAKKATGGNKKLAMFKADIDNLGLIFALPWGDGTEGKVSFSRYAQLSRQIHYFFTAFISWYIKDQEDYKDKIYTVFSGGDDLCVLGPWDEVMRFASDFQKKLSEFTGGKSKEPSEFTRGNPSVTLSGGIALAAPHLPVRAIAEMAEEALKKAKRRQGKDKKGETIPVKNAVSVFDVIVDWKEYEKSLKEDAKAIIDYLEDNTVSIAVIYKMIDFANRAKAIREGDLQKIFSSANHAEKDKKVTIRDGLWMGNYRYIIARNIDPEDSDAIKFFDRFGVCPDTMEKSRIAVSYALYIKRKGKYDTEEEKNA